MERPASPYRELFEKAFNEKRVQNLVTSKEFYHQKAIDKYIEFRDFERRYKSDFAKKIKRKGENIFENLILEYDRFRKTGTSTTFGDFLELKTSDSLEYQILLTIGQLIAYIDAKAYNRNEWNEYDDKRYLARAGVYQPQWVINLLRFKSTGNDFNSLSSVIRNAILFLENPGERLTVLAPKHREYIITNLLSREYNEQYFDADIITFFNELGFSRGIIFRENQGVIFSRMLYNTQVRAIWDESNKERLSKSQEVHDKEADEELLQQDLEVDVEEAEKEIEEIIVSIKGSPVSQADRIAEKDLLGREKLTDALFRMIRGVSPPEGLPLTIGLFGKWGLGKSSVFKLTLKKLEERDPGKYRTVEFNAWQHEHVPNIAAGLAQQTVKELTGELNSLRKLLLRLQFAFKQHFWSSLLSLIGVFGTVTFLLIAIFTEAPPKESFTRTSELSSESPGSKRDSVATTYKVTQSVVRENIGTYEEFKNDTTLKPDSTLSIVKTKKVTISNDPDKIKALDDKVRQHGSLLNILLNITSGGGLFLFIYFLKRLSDDPLTTKFIQSTKIPDYSDQLGLVVKIQQQLEWLTQLVLKKDQRMLVFIDDLDRCTKNSIIKTFEAIKLVMDMDNTIVIVAIDQRIALQAIGDYYATFSTKKRPVADIARDYLGKIIQLPIQISDPDPLHIESYVKNELFKGRGNEIEAEKQGQTVKVSDDSPTAKETEEQSISDQSTDDSIDEENSDGSKELEGTVENEDVEADTDVEDKESDGKETEDEDQDMEETDDEVRYFIQYTNFFRFTNPRLMRRLRNSYRILKKIESGKEGIKLMFMLFLLEYLYSRSSKTTIEEKTIEFDTDVFTDVLFNTKIMDEIAKLKIDNLVDLQDRTEQVVLPFTPADN